jgi:hypothetical protein
MQFRLVDKGWDGELQEALKADSSSLRIICPFIKTGTISRILSICCGHACRELRLKLTLQCGICSTLRAIPRWGLCGQVLSAPH